MSDKGKICPFINEYCLEENCKLWDYNMCALQNSSKLTNLILRIMLRKENKEDVSKGI